MNKMIKHIIKGAKDKGSKDLLMQEEIAHEINKLDNDQKIKLFNKIIDKNDSMNVP